MGWTELLIILTAGAAFVYYLRQPEGGLDRPEVQRRAKRLADRARAFARGPFTTKRAVLLFLVALAGISLLETRPILALILAGAGAFVFSLERLPWEAAPPATPEPAAPPVASVVPPAAPVEPAQRPVPVMSAPPAGMGSPGGLRPLRPLRPLPRAPRQPGWGWLKKGMLFLVVGAGACVLVGILATGPESLEHDIDWFLSHSDDVVSSGEGAAPSVPTAEITPTVTADSSSAKGSRTRRPRQVKISTERIVAREKKAPPAPRLPAPPAPSPPLPSAPSPAAAALGPSKAETPVLAEPSMPKMVPLEDYAKSAEKSKIDSSSTARAAVLGPDAPIEPVLGKREVWVESSLAVDVAHAEIEASDRAAQTLVVALAASGDTPDPGLWSPSTDWVLQRMVKEKRVEEHRTPTGELRYQARLRLSLLPAEIEKVYRRYIADTKSARTLQVAKLYAGTVLMLGGFAMVTRLGTGRRSGN